MANIGTTTGDKPDFVQDEDLRSLEELRGFAERLDNARLSLNEKGTIQGVLANQDILKQQLEMTHEQLRHLIGLYGTLRNEFDQFQTQRVIELQSWLANGGSTTPEDYEDNGPNS
jgi:hypothetical protein